MHLTGKRAGGPITFTAKIVGVGATADFSLLTDNYQEVVGAAINNSSWSFTVQKSDLADTTEWPPSGNPTLQTETPVWNSGSPTIHLAAVQDGATLPNSDVTGGDPTLLAVIDSGNATGLVPAAFTFDLT
jgi:hypothetical protein